MTYRSIRVAVKKSFEPLGIGTNRHLIKYQQEFVEFVDSFSRKKRE